jgi:hypothetical protein
MKLVGVVPEILVMLKFVKPPLSSLFQREDRGDFYDSGKNLKDILIRVCP